MTLNGTPALAEVTCNDCDGGKAVESAVTVKAICEGVAVKVCAAQWFAAPDQTTRATAPLTRRGRGFIALSET
jgi:hypothetical protein